MTTSSKRNLIRQLHLRGMPILRGVPLRLALAGAFAAFALAPTARAVSPPPDGGYPNGNTAEGENALFSLSSAFGNTAIGYNALYNDISGASNTATGAQALFSSTTGELNTAYGAIALFSNITGSDNTASGAQALYSNTSGNSNTACGYSALSSNTEGTGNTAAGFQALFYNLTGGENTAQGFQALISNTNGNFNVATGADALYYNTTGSFNVATGPAGLYNNTIGDQNTSNGNGALYSNTTGDSNTACGALALRSNTTGSGNIAMGTLAGTNLTTGSDNIDIGNAGAAGESGKIRIGTKGTHQNTFIAGVFGVTLNGSQVLVNSNGKLGSVVSSERFKDEIKPMDKASEAILALQPVSFRYKQELDPTRMAQFGLVAEQVATVDPDLVIADETGKPFTVRYEQVNAMLLNEFLKEHRRVDEEARRNWGQEAAISDLKSVVAQQQKKIEALTAGLQKVSNQLKMTDQHRESP